MFVKDFDHLLTVLFCAAMFLIGMASEWYGA